MALPNERPEALDGMSALDVLAAVDVGVLAIDGDGVATYANATWERSTGQIGGRWRGQGWQRLLADPASDLEHLLAGCHGTTPLLEILIQADGTPRVLRLSGSAGAGGIVVTCRDVSDERAATEALTRAATRDALTGLWNRAQFLEFLENALAHQRREPGRQTAVFFLDVDDLKATNDAAGHAAGDRMLQSVARCITASVRPGDVVARYAGDEFTVLCDEIDGELEALAIAGRVLEAVADSPHVSCSVSLGIATARGPQDQPGDIVARADADMYRVKRQSRVRRPGSWREPRRAPGRVL